MVQTSPRPAASTLQALRIGKYLEGHLSKPLHAALFTPSPTPDTHAVFLLHSETSFIISLLELLKCFLHDALPDASRPF